jgi:hypothetical protein
MLALSEDRTTLHVMQKDVKLVGLIRIAVVIKEDVGTTPAFGLWGDSDRFGCRCIGSSSERGLRATRCWNTTVSNNAV